MNLTRTILFTLCFMLIFPVWAQAEQAVTTGKSVSATTAKTAASSQSVQNTGAASQPVPAPATFDDKVQREADEQIRRSEGELGYLGAAYAAAFLILGIFLWSTRRGQQQLADEVKELQARIDEALAAKPGSDA